MILSKMSNIKIMKDKMSKNKLAKLFGAKQLFKTVRHLLLIFRKIAHQNMNTLQSFFNYFIRNHFSIFKIMLSAIWRAVVSSATWQHFK